MVAECGLTDNPSLLDVSGVLTLLGFASKEETKDFVVKVQDLNLDETKVQTSTGITALFTSVLFDGTLEVMKSY